MNKKGFTLIELLAVIIILAIIALIAVPTILNIIDNSKKKALVNSAYGMISAAELYYTEGLLINNTVDKTFSGPEYTDLNFKGEKVENGEVKVNNVGDVSIWLYQNNYCVYKNMSDVQVQEQDNVGSSEECSNLMSNETESSSISCTSTSGTVSYALGTSYTCDPGDGPRTFYVLEEGTDTVSLIMNENLGDRVAWNTSGNNADGPVTALAYLEEQTSNWTVDVSLPTGQQIANAIGNTSWTSGGSDIDLSSAPWLYGNLYTSSNTSLPDGYWTSTPNSSNSFYAWHVRYYGRLYDGNVDDTDDGVRPVITVSKSQLSQ